MTAPLRVVLTNFRSPWDPLAGGGQTATDDLARALVAAGHRVHAVFAGEPGPTPPVPYAIRWVRARRRPWWTAVALARKTHALVRREGADVVHTSGYEGAFIDGRLTHVATLHAPDLPVWSPPPLHRPWKRVLFLRRSAGVVLERRRMMRARAVVFVSEHSREKANGLGYRCRQAVVIPNGVDVEVFRPAALSRPARPVVLFVGRFDEQKGVDVLLQAWRALDGRAELHLAGTGWREERYRELAASLGLRTVSFIGHVPRQQLPALLNQARLLVLPSRYENFPISLLEAMSCGIPVVTTRVGGIPELVTAGREGLLVPPEDVGALSGALITLVDDAERARAMGEEGRRTIGGRYSWDIIAARMVALYRELLSAPTGLGRP
jgi:glycosyltransferase involved in cell wall biosynthesis